MSTSPQYDEKELFARISRGDEAAFETIFRQYSSKFLPFLIRMLGSDLLARDVIQEAFVQLWINRDQLDQVNNPAGWFYTITSRRAYQQLRNDAKAQLEVAGLLQNLPRIEENDAARQLQMKKIREALDKAVRDLSEGRRKVFTMIRIEGLSRKETAAMLGISENTVRNQLSSATEQIHAALKNAGYSSLPLILILATLGL